MLTLCGRATLNLNTIYNIYYNVFLEKYGSSLLLLVLRLLKILWKFAKSVVNVLDMVVKFMFIQTTSRSTNHLCMPLGNLYQLKNDVIFHMCEVSDICIFKILKFQILSQLY